MQFGKMGIKERKEDLKMLITKKMLLVLTLVGALVGAGIGALVTHSASGNTQAANTASTTPAYDTTQTAQTANQTQKTPEEIAAGNASQFQTSQEQTAYRQGFDDGYTGCTNAQASTSSRTVAYNTYNSAPVRVRRYSNGRKHRDKLTLAMGTGGGAMLGGLIGGKKGAGIGALAGLGGSALYTYKLRHRHHRY
ncbi:MAG: hypothetical protein DMF71_11425 [Acidobacteria bacterium]|nr:MAG: hypothetical protein DMF71_11425 [Acidobacteriota bacterium]